MFSKLQKTQWLKAGIFEKWWGEGWSSYTKENTEILNWLKRFTKEENKNGKGFLLSGINGIGKTMLLNITLMKKMEQGKSVHIIPYWVLLQEYLKSWSNEGSYKELLRYDYLGINDFGKGYESDKAREMAKGAIEFILDYRIQRQKPLLITTNLEPKAIRKEYGHDIASKINEACILCIFQEKDRIADDYRIKHNTIIKG